MAHNFRGFRGFLKFAKIKLVKFGNTIYSKLVIRENCFREMLGNSNPRKLCASKIWTYTVVPVHSQCGSLVLVGRSLQLGLKLHLEHLAQSVAKVTVENGLDLLVSSVYRKQKLQ